jgi:hypothetical protein
MDKVKNPTTTLGKKFNDMVDSLEECPHPELVSRTVSMTMYNLVKVELCLACGDVTTTHMRREHVSE